MECTTRCTWRCPTHCTGGSECRGVETVKYIYIAAEPATCGDGDGHPAPIGIKQKQTVFCVFLFALKSPPTRRYCPLVSQEMTDHAFAMTVGNGMAIEPQIMARMLTELARFEIAAFEQERAYAPARCPVAARCAMERQLAISEALRQALAVGDREVARAPLRTVARHLGIHLDESDIDWPALAYQASRVLVDIAKERARREDGQYINQSDWFQAGMNVAAHSARFTHVASADLLGSFALAGDRDHTPSQFASRPDATGCRAVEIKEGAQSCAQKTAGLKDHSSAATKYQPVEPNISTAAPMPLQKPPAER